MDGWRWVICECGVTLDGGPGSATWQPYMRVTAVRLGPHDWRCTGPKRRAAMMHAARSPNPSKLRETARALALAPQRDAG